MLSQLSNWPLAALELEGIKTISVSFSDLYTRISPWFSQYSILETQQSWTPKSYLVVLQSRNQELWNTFTALKFFLSKQGTKQDSTSEKSHLEKQKNFRTLPVLNGIFAIQLLKISCFHQHGLAEPKFLFSNFRISHLQTIRYCTGEDIFFYLDKTFTSEDILENFRQRYKLVSHFTAVHVGLFCSFLSLHDILTG